MGRQQWFGIVIRLVILWGVGMASLLVAAGSARANHYDVYACYAGQGTYLNPSDSNGSWTLSDNNSHQRYLPYDQCGSTDNGMGAISVSGYAASSGQEASLSFTAPSGLRLEHVRLWRSFYDYGIGTGPTSQRGALDMTADGKPVGESYDGTQDVTHGSVGSGDTTANGIVPSNLIDVDLQATTPQTFTYTIYCGFSQCPTGGNDPTSPSGWDEKLAIYGAIVSVQDNVPPTLTVANTGLFGAGTQRGVSPLTLSAADASGIARLEIYAGGASTPALSQDLTQTNRCQFWQAMPCQNLAGYEWPVDTTQLPDGTYFVTVKAYDPANNVVAESSPAEVRVDNAPAPALASGSGGQPSISGRPVVGGLLQASPGQWTGSNLSFAYQWQHCAPDGSACSNISGATDSAYTPISTDQGRALRVLVTASNPEGSSTAGSAATSAVAPASAGAGPAAPGATGNPQALGSPSVTDRGPANGSGASDHPRFSTNGHRYVTVGFGHAYTLSGRLYDENGSPISHASMVVLGQVLGSHVWRPVSTVTTAADGTYSIAVPPGPSRLLRVGYRSHLNDRDYANFDDTIEYVVAHARLRTTPAHVRNHQRVVFRGQLLGGHVPAGGKGVEIQVLVGRHWRDVVGARSDATGRFSASYRFTRTFLTISYTFRAIVRGESGYPYRPGTSNAARVRVN